MDSHPVERGSLDLATLVAVVCLIASWFWLNTLVTDVGRFQLNFHFYDLWTLIRDPGLLLTGISDTRTAGAIAFGAFCVIAALAPLLVLMRDTTATRLAAVVPLLVMVVFGGWLYLKTSTNVFSIDAAGDSVGGQIVGMANSITNTLVGKIADRVDLGLGAWVGLLAASFLAVWRMMRGIVR
jgi:hypothetical protein